MEQIAAQIAVDLADADAEDILRWAVATFGDRICVTSSMTDAVIVHMASAIRPGIDVIFLDTGYHFAETIGTRDAVAAVYPVNLINVEPSRTVAEQDAELGPRLYRRNPDLCCYLRKVEPLERALSRYDAWITGLRRDETIERRDAGPVEWDGRREMVKVNPIVSWQQKQVDDYIAENGILVNQMTEQMSVKDIAETVQAAFPGDVTIEHLDNPRVEAPDHYYNVKHTQLVDLGLEPHLPSTSALSAPSTAAAVRYLTRAFSLGTGQVCGWYQAAWAWCRRRDSYNSGMAPWRRQPPVPEGRSPRG